MGYFPEPQTLNKSKRKLKLDLSNYATQKNATGVDTSKFLDLTCVKSEVDKLDIDKLTELDVDNTGFNTKIKEIKEDKIPQKF